MAKRRRLSRRRKVGAPASTRKRAAWPNSTLALLKDAESLARDVLGWYLSGSGTSTPGFIAKHKKKWTKIENALSTASRRSGSHIPSLIAKTSQSLLRLFESANSLMRAAPVISHLGYADILELFSRIFWFFAYIHEIADRKWKDDTCLNPFHGRTMDRRQLAERTAQLHREFEDRIVTCYSDHVKRCISGTCKKSGDWTYLEFLDSIRSVEAQLYRICMLEGDK